jgi:hypothetical protein
MSNVRPLRRATPDSPLVPHWGVTLFPEHVASGATHEWTPLRALAARLR